MLHFSNFLVGVILSIGAVVTFAFAVVSMFLFVMVVKSLLLIVPSELGLLVAALITALVGSLLFVGVAVLVAKVRLVMWVEEAEASVVALVVDLALACDALIVEVVFIMSVELGCGVTSVVDEVETPLFLSVDIAEVVSVSIAIDASSPEQ